MSKITNPTLVPELRFPEFINSWEIKHIGKVAKNLDYKRKPITQQERISGSTPYYGASGIIDYVDGYIYDESLLCISEDGANLIARSYPIAFSIHGKTWVNNHAHVLKFKYSHMQTIVENYLNNISLEDYLTGMAQPKLNRAKLDIIPIPLPLDLKEQQKIADFLSSMDDLIATNTKKLELLKFHKKGLMQKLFPAEGESVPELRFDRFNESWKKRPFSKLFEIGSGKDHKHLADGDIPVYGSGGYMRSVNDYLYEGKSACIGRKGTINKPMLLAGKFWTVDTLFYTHSFKNCIPEFVYLLFQNIDWLKLNEAGGVPSLSKVIINKIEVFIPEEDEQQRIVDCVSSLDELIKIESDKIEALKEYKKGLMQQLFPEIKESIA
ncbi:restriction endonuclease subunit S [Vibrio fluvialis]|uniref:restriction endonuclease subunit S n=1 Tax=Vibrio fluvialis TaxID=676 RepID=UPI001C9CA85F|nr:restriction endonuclease subunit S [Vibrio fluvialis]MBY7936186.1 restriction endonuclease subunit S [Vibrio fluvialis]MCE7580673.1 restriction endonuclease subunit S [Vibrio fluvialis]